MDRNNPLPANKTTITDKNTETGRQKITEMIAGMTDDGTSSLKSSCFNNRGRNETVMAVKNKKGLDWSGM